MRTPTLLSSLPLAGALCVSCGDNSAASGAAPIGDVESIRVEPAEATVVVRTGEPAELDFAAWATFSNGVEAPIDLVSWASSSPSAGDIDSSGHLVTVDTNGGITEISATQLDVVGTATVTVIYTEDFVEDGADAAMVDAFAGSEPSADPELTLTYPPDGVTVPRNLEGLGFGWFNPDGHNAARLRFRSDITDISIYLFDANRWFATSDLWGQIAAANRDGRVDVTVETGVWDGSALSDTRIGEPTSLSVNRLDAQGSVLYWATAVEGIMRIPLGSTEAQAFFGLEQTGSCVGCHVVNNPTDLMVVTYGGFNGKFAVLDVADPDNPEIIVDQRDDQRVTFKNLSPDGRYMMASNQRQLKLYELETGNLITQYDFGEDTILTQPDWAPDSSAIVAVRVVRDYMTEFDFAGGEIVVFPFENEGLGDPVPLVPADPTYNYYYPAWSPDGDWIAYNRTIGSGYASRQAELFIVSVDGSMNLRLDAASGEGELQNSYARWGPLPDDDVLWLAYSSRRPYTLQDRGQPQIWVSAIDVQRALDGVDPSSAPFWLPGQSPDSDNHLPVWWDE